MTIITSIHKATIKCGLELFLDEIVEKDNFCFALSHYIKDYFCNYAYVKDLQSFNAYDLEAFFLERELAPSVYVHGDQVSKFGCPDNYLLAHHDIWMNYDLDSFSYTKDLESTDRLEFKINTKSSRQDFLDVLNKVYIQSDASEIYGALDNGYLKRTQIAFETGKKCHFLVGYYKKLPVSIGIVCICGDIGGLYSGGTLKEYRGKGFGSLMIQERLKIAKENGCKNVFLGTEKGTYNHKHFSKLGFKDLYEGVCYYKKV